MEQKEEILAAAQQPEEAQQPAEEKQPDMKTLAELLAKMEQNTQRSGRYDKAQFYMSLVTSVACVILMVVVSVGVLTLYTRMDGIVNSANEILTQVDLLVDDTGSAVENINNVAVSLNKVDYERLTGSVTTLAEEGTKSIGEALGALETTMEGAQEAVDQLKKIDVDSLNQSIDELNAVLTPLSRFFGR